QRTDYGPTGFHHIGTLEERGIANHAIMQQTLVSRAGLLAKIVCILEIHVDAAKRMMGPGTFAANLNDMPSSGWMCRTNWFGIKFSTGVSRNRTNGALRNWMTIWVFRAGSRLPVRR